MTMAARQGFSEDEIEEIMNMRAPDDPLSITKVREAIQQNPILVTALAFAFGMLLGIGFASNRKK